MSNLVVIDRPSPSVASIALNKPERRNPIGPDVRDALIPALESVLADDSARAIVLCGSNGMFCSGGDISSMKQLPPQGGRARLKAHHKLVRLFAEAEKPVVAAVEGFAMGAGGGLALLADIIVMGEGAQMGFPFFKLGLMPDYGILYTLPKRVGMGVAKQALMLGTMYKGPEALAVGMVDKVVPDPQVMGEALKIAEELGSHSRFATAMAKQLLAKMPESLDGALEMEAMGQALLISSADFAEGTTAFMEKRKPKF
ncbi:MAG TPA: enoyl-CoA hydratase-related protein [bacterium]